VKVSIVGSFAIAGFGAWATTAEELIATLQMVAIWSRRSMTSP
jgi:hypothetical protein